MKIFEIYDEETASSIGTLLYYEKAKAFIMELCDDLDEWTAPLIATSYVKRNIYTIPKDIAILWVRQRIIPSGRQNIGDILKNHRLKAYDEMKFLEIAEGRCSQDNLVIKPLHEIPEYVIERQNKNIIEVVPLEKQNLLCFFVDNTTRKIELNELIDIDGIDKVIKHKELFDSVKTSVGGYGITFDDSIEVSAKDLYSGGIEIPLCIGDFKSFVINNIFDTTKSCEVLECSRQNTSYLVKQNLLSPLKEEVKGNLYLKGDVEKIKW